MSVWKEVPVADAELTAGAETLEKLHRHFVLGKLHCSPQEENAAENLEFQVEMDFGNFL